MADLVHREGKLTEEQPAAKPDGRNLAGLDPLVQDGRRRDDDMQGVSGADTFKNHWRSGEGDSYIAGGCAPECVDDFHHSWLNRASAEHTDFRVTHDQVQNPKRQKQDAFLKAIKTGPRIAGL